MQTVQLTPDVIIGSQPAAEDFPRLATEGVTLVINNRPDGEDPGQMTAAAAAELAARHGLGYRHIPVTMASLSREDVTRFAEAMAGSEGKVLAHCRSGMRSATLWALSRILTGDMTREEVLTAARARGIDLREALTWLDRQPSAAPR